MSRTLLLCVALATLSSVTAASSAQQLPPGHPAVGNAADTPAREAGPLPPGHPAVGNAADAPAREAGPLPPGHPPVTSPEPEAESGNEPVPEALPAGHPATDGGDTHPNMQGEPPPDRVDRAPELPAGTIEVMLRDEKDSPTANQPVELTILRQDVAEGDSTQHRSAVTDAEGRAVFGSLPQSTDFTFRIMAPRKPATFSSDTFQLTSGPQRVLLHTYPSTNDVRQALVGLRGIVVVEPREDVFHIEASYEIFNIGRVAWVPGDWTLSLPDGAKAFQAAEGDTRFEKKGESTIGLAGTFGPGRHEVGYSFQVDNDHVTERTFRLALPPHVAELRVVAEAARGMKLEVPDMPEPQRVLAQSGSWMLVTGRQLMRGEAPLDWVTFTLSGLPSPSSGRWYAVGISVLLAAAGLWTFLRESSQPQGKTPSDDTKRARRLLLDELVLLERLRAEKQIGPRSYDSSRRALLDALARLETAAEKTSRALDAGAHAASG